MASGLIAHCATTILVNFYLADMQTGDDGSVIVSFAVNKVFGSALMIHGDICAPNYCYEHFGNIAPRRWRSHEKRHGEKFIPANAAGLLRRNGRPQN
jgi:hypothetical protein